MISDRGPARYFHGRKRALSRFNGLLKRAIQESGGTTYLIQGAPGAGKSALLIECEKYAAAGGWKVAMIHPSALWDTSALMHSLGRGQESEITEHTGKIEAPIVKGEYKSVPIQSTTLSILREGRLPLLLSMDEAHRVERINTHMPDKVDAASSVLEEIHNGKLGRPVVLIAAGLGTTVNAFGELGISRFARKCVVELGALDKESQCAVIHDWLKKDGRAKGDPTAWIEAIAQETHGWPQHIMSYVEPALDQLEADDGIMTADGLNVVLEAGREERATYYEERVRGFHREQLNCIARSIANVPPGSSVDYSVIMSSLMQEYRPDKAENLFHKALKKGILDERENRYVVPIPSMHDWLVSNFARIQVKFAHSEQINQTRSDQDSGRGFGR